MGGRRRLKGGRPRLLSRHDGLEGARYRRAYAALMEEVGPAPSELARMEVGRVAVAWVNLTAATEALDHARRQRRTRGKGQVPSVQRIERLSKRQGLANKTYTDALEKLRAQASKWRRTPSPNGNPLAEALMRAPVLDGDAP